MTTRRQSSQEHSDRLSEKRSQAVVEAAKAGSPSQALTALEQLAKTPEFKNFNVNSPNNQQRLLKHLGIK